LSELESWHPQGELVEQLVGFSNRRPSQAAKDGEQWSHTRNKSKTKLKEILEECLKPVGLVSWGILNVYPSLNPCNLNPTIVGGVQVRACDIDRLDAFSSHNLDELGCIWIVPAELARDREQMYRTGNIKADC